MHSTNDSILLAESESSSLNGRIRVKLSERRLRDPAGLALKPSLLASLGAIFDDSAYKLRPLLLEFSPANPKPALFDQPPF